MNLLYGEVIELFEEKGLKVGRVRVSGTVKTVPLELLADVRCGDTVLLCDNVAISRVEEKGQTEC
jgi:hydrogenase maturation factor